MWKGRTVSKHLAYKILSDHLVTRELAQGNEIGVQIDQILIHDGTGQVAILQLEALGIKRVKTKKSVTYTGQNTLQVAFIYTDDHHFLAWAGKKLGIHYSKAGNGICTRSTWNDFPDRERSCRGDHLGKEHKGAD